MNTMNAEPLSSSGKKSEKLCLLTLQNKMKADPDGYLQELLLIHDQFNAALDLFQQQATLNSLIPADPTIAKDLSDRASFLAHVLPFYPGQLTTFPTMLVQFLSNSASNLPSGLRGHVTQALILLVNRKMVDIEETLFLFTVLQTLGDRTLKKLAFTHVIQSVKRINVKHKNDPKNRALQKILFKTLEMEDEAPAKRSLVTLCELHRRKVWFDDTTSDAICKACFHPVPKIMIAALSFLLDYDKIEDADDSDESSSSEDESSAKLTNVTLSKEAIYKAHHKGTIASKKKKKAKLQRVMRSMKRRQRVSSENNSSHSYSPLNHLKDSQGFVEKLFSRLQTCNERFEVKMMMLKVIARTIGLHKLILLKFYPFLQKYIQPHQRNITELLASAIQACHDMIPPDVVEPLFRQLVNQFVHDRSRPEVIAVGLNTVREICLRMPLLMTEELLQDLVLYRKTHEKAVSAAARSLITLFRELCPSFLVKKDRGRLTDPQAKPKAFGETKVAENVPGIELLQQENDTDSDSDDDVNEDDDNYDAEEVNAIDDNVDDAEIDDAIDVDEGNELSDETSDEEMVDSENESGSESEEEDDCDEKEVANNSETKKRKLSDFNKQLAAADSSLRALKRLAGEKHKPSSTEAPDGILSNEDFEKIKGLNAKKNANFALERHGFKIPTSDQLGAKPVDPMKLEAHVKKKMTKEERLQLVRAGREDREKYQSRTAVKQKKTGGKSNREKEHNKKMPIAAKRQKIGRSRREKAMKTRHSAKQFRGKKAWK